MCALCDTSVLSVDYMENIYINDRSKGEYRNRSIFLYRSKKVEYQENEGQIDAKEGKKKNPYIYHVNKCCEVRQFSIISHST